MTESVNSTPFYHKWKETGISRPYFIWPVLYSSFRINCLRNIFFTIASDISLDEDISTVAVQIWTAKIQLGAEGLKVWRWSRLDCYHSFSASPHNPRASSSKIVQDCSFVQL